MLVRLAQTAANCGLGLGLLAGGALVARRSVAAGSLFAMAGFWEVGTEMLMRTLANRAAHALQLHDRERREFLRADPNRESLRRHGVARLRRARASSEGAYVTALITLAVSIALVVVIAMNARRVGRSLWLLAAVPSLWIGFTILFRLGSMLKAFDHTSDVFIMLDIADACATSLTAILVVVACALLR